MFGWRSRRANPDKILTAGRPVPAQGLPAGNGMECPPGQEGQVEVAPSCWDNNLYIVAGQA